jgi:hypothetical protein
MALKAQAFGAIGCWGPARGFGAMHPISTLVAITTPLSTRFQCDSGVMARSAESPTEANASGTASSTVAAAGDLDSWERAQLCRPWKAD